MSSSEQRLDEGRDGFTFGALYLATAWLRSKVANVTPRCGTEERFSPFPLRLFLSSSLYPFLSLTLCLFVSSPLSLFDSLPLRLVCIMFLPYFCNWLDAYTHFDGIGGGHAFVRFRLPPKRMQCLTIENILRHAVAALKQAASPPRNRHFIRTHKPSHRHSSCDGKANDFRQRLQASL